MVAGDVPAKSADGRAGTAPGDLDFVQLTTSPLDLAQTAALVADKSAGAIATFSGTTRGTFRGKGVVRLEYEAYVPMAERELRRLVSEARARWPLVRVALRHRLGAVPVGETSVVVAVSAEHRDAALEAARMLIDRLKETVPIWKKEVYEDGSAWKGAEQRDFAG
ncbi:MAG: Molybdopterin biosynthesis MoaE [Olpidium bornovanus]|uniref:Molybdopterin synthase catalytic subunit n=1 Tax=Olpidium bornovanus TaxID=278681 RepID=A0A8H7ZQR5_9FUNG|nr:MAG: Molybdopterin biosynthesis MoaE [Olpidium bornovanus]